LVSKLRIRSPELSDQLSRGELDAFTRLAFAIEVADQTGSAPLIQQLDLVVEAAVATRPGIALEIGGLAIGANLEIPVRTSVVIADNHIPGIISLRTF
jgi:hypothetical protein